MRKRWVSLAGFLCLAAMGAIHAQTAGNMVYNPSFEEHRNCPQRIDAMGVMCDVDAWWQPTMGSSDYFHSCGGRECAVPRNKMGMQAAHSGEAYCGIYCSQEQYREYLQTELITPLEAGSRYRVSFWVCLADKSPHAISSLGALITKERPQDSSYSILMDREVTKLGEQQLQSIAVYYTPQVVNSTDNLLDDSKEWHEISGEFIAEGGEKFLTIGNFHSFNKSHVVQTQRNSPSLSGAYYYIVDVSLTRVDDAKNEVPQTKDTLPPVDEPIRLEGVYFASGASEVLPQSYNELIRLKAMMEKHPDIRIELRGHTDDQGTYNYNQKLSEARARAVAEFLIEKGISRQRLTWVGFGESLPTGDNSTEQGRQSNRRVEYRILAD